MTRKTPEEIEARKEQIRNAAGQFRSDVTMDGALVRSGFINGAEWADSSNQELSDFKKELVEKVKAKNAELKSKGLILSAEHILDLITQEDKPEGGKEENNGNN
jgi:hypothetical protein